jgi:hypothetical protein
MYWDVGYKAISESLWLTFFHLLIQTIPGQY